MRKIDPTKIKKILCVRPDALGDVVLITPCLQALQQQFSHARISLLLREYSKDLLAADNRYEIITHPLAENHGRGLGNLFGLVKVLREKRFDVVIHFYSEFPYALATLLAGIPYRIGNRKKMLFGWIFNYGVPVHMSDITKHEVEHNFELLAPLGINTPPPPLKLTAQKDAIQQINQKLSAAGITASDTLIGIHLGTGGSGRPWTAEGYAAVANNLAQNYKVVLTGGEREQAMEKQVQALCSSAITSFVNCLTLSELVAFYARANLYIGKDTGPMHMAAAFQVPSVAIHTDKISKPIQWGPWKNKHIAIRKSAGCPHACHPKQCTYDYCLKQVTAEEVLSAAKTLLLNQPLPYQDTLKYWCRLSFNILFLAPNPSPQVQQLYQQLKDAGYNIQLCTQPLSLHQLIILLVSHDINIIHHFAPRPSFLIYVAKLLSALSLGIPPLFIHDRSPQYNSTDDLINSYIEKFKHRRYL